jgi:hypothetical protein
MDLSIVVNEPKRKQIQNAAFNLIFVARYQIKSQIMLNRITALLDNYGHTIGVSDFIINDNEKSLKIHFLSGRSDKFYWSPSTTEGLTVSDAHEMVNDLQTVLWSLLEITKREKNTEFYH